MFNDNIVMVSPINTVKTPNIIGFLTYPYIPQIINFLVGLQGANVPFPIFIKLDIVRIITYNPRIIIISPITKVEIYFMDMFFSM